MLSDQPIRIQAQRQNACQIAVQRQIERHPLALGRHRRRHDLLDQAPDRVAGLALMVGFGQALRAIAGESDLRWFLLPGNHDSLAASELWRRIRADAPANVVILADPQPLELATGVWLLPAPCPHRRPGRDLTETMAVATPEGAVRIGLGHGAVTDFSSDEGSPGIIPPDRAQRAGLDYLGLGDWHGQRQIGPATWYSGTPEADGFKHETAPAALVVRIAGSRAPAQTTSVQTGQFRWLRPQLDLLPGEDVASRLAGVLPAETQRRDSLLRIEAHGRLTLAERATLDSALADVAPDFGWFEAHLTSLGSEVRADDLDLIDRGGALREAAEALMSEVGDPALAQAERHLAEQALSRLYALVQEVDA